MMSKEFSIFLILFTAALLFGWRSFENRMKEEAKFETKVVVDSTPKPDSEKIKKQRKLEQLVVAEKAKIKVMVEHDNNPATTTYPMILDASGSFDPDMGDNIQFKWRKISGPPVVFRPNGESEKVSFIGLPGEYEFELTVSDDYEAKTIVRKTVVIEPEPNVSPIIDMKVKQGSELK